MTREEAIKYIKSRCIGSTEERDGTQWSEAMWTAIKALSEQKTGEWVRKYDKQINCYWYECNQCGEYRPRNVFGKEWSSPYCPNCGTRMYKGGESDG